jgi:aryl-alcohol dehydrogenase-like predicted oxidoreductase
MQYRQVGKSGLRVSALSLGSWLTYGRNVADNTAEQIVDAAYECGINSFATANGYYRGAAEPVLGKALGKYPRSSLVISSKIFFPMGEGPNDHGLSRKHLTEQLDAILSRLQTDYLDILYCPPPSRRVHAPLRNFPHPGRFHPPGEGALRGVSEWTGRAAGGNPGAGGSVPAGPHRGASPLYNLSQPADREEVLPLCRREGIGRWCTRLWAWAC